MKTNKRLTSKASKKAAKAMRDNRKRNPMSAKGMSRIAAWA